MSQRLSTSVTFQALNKRVDSLESNYAAGFTPGGIAAAVGYVPVNKAGDAFTGPVVSDIFRCPPSGSAGGIGVSRAFSSGYTGIVEFLRSDGTRNGFVGFNAEGGPMHYGSDTGAGHYFEGGTISPDPNMHFGLRFNTIDGILDFDSNDYIHYSRSNDEYLFMIGGVAQLALSGGGLQVSNVFTVGDGNFGMSLNGNSPYIAFDNTDFLGYDRSTNVFSFNIGNAGKAQIDSAGNLSNTGTIFPGGDANYLLGVFANIPRVQFDANDNLAYDRAGNTYSFNIAGSSACNITPTSLTANGLSAPTISVDASFYASLNASNPQIVFDSGDMLQFNRATNSYNLTLSNSTQLSVNGTGTFVANVLTVGDNNFGMSLNGGSQPLVLYDSGDYACFIRSSNVYSWAIGNATKATLDSSGNFIAYGALLASGDSNFGLSIPIANNPRLTFDTGSDHIAYDRTANKFYFVIGGVNVASIDASGNVRIKGTLTQSVTP